MNKRANPIRGLVSDPMSGSRLDSLTQPPSPALAHVVEYFWVVRWDLRGQPPHTAKLLGDPCVHIAFESGSSRVVGVWTRAWERVVEGRGLIRAVKIRAGAAPLLVSAPIHELTDRITPLEKVIPCDAAALERQVLEPQDNVVAFARFGTWLQSKLLPVDGAAIDLAVRLVRQIQSSPELMTVESLAEASGVPLRSLQRLFRDVVGASPKWVIRRHRLQEAALQIESGTLTSLSALAAALGYADQAHLTRDFKHAVGLTPRAFAQRDV